jgi:mRNA interferase MazF
MLTSGDVVYVELGQPAGREAGFRHPAVVVTAQRILDNGPSIVQIVPLTSTIRAFDSEVVIEEEASGLTSRSAAQCQHIRAISVARLDSSEGNVGPTSLAQIREVLATILDIPN